MKTHVTQVVDVPETALERRQRRHDHRLLEGIRRGGEREDGQRGVVVTTLAGHCFAA